MPLIKASFPSTSLLWRCSFPVKHPMANDVKLPRVFLVLSGRGGQRMGGSEMPTEVNYFYDFLN